MAEESKNQKEEKTDEKAAVVKVEKREEKKRDKRDEVREDRENKSVNVIVPEEKSEKKDEKKEKESASANSTSAAPLSGAKRVALADKEVKELIAEEEKKEKVGKDDDLPEEIKKKLEKNKIERAKQRQLKKKKKGPKKAVKVGKAYIKATYNNTIVTLTDLSGDVISWASAGVAGFKGPKKATPYAAQIITKIACLKAKEEYGLEEVSVFVRGVGTGRESAVRALNANGLIITFIKDITPIPHNGCRPKKPRRV